MPPAGDLGRRRRAAALVLVCVTLAAVATFHKSSPRVPLKGAPDQAAADVLHVARNQIGDAYQWGGNGPNRWDCSGLTSLWRSVGGAKGMPRVSRDQQRWTIPVHPADVKRGDLVFFGHPVTHVGIVSGGGYMIDAGRSRSAVVERRIWSSGVVRYGRVPRPGMPKVRPWTPPRLPAPTPGAPIADSPAAARPARPVAKPSSGGLPSLQGFPVKQKHPSSRAARRAAQAAAALEGKKAGPGGLRDVQLVRHAWRASGVRLPMERARLAARGKRVRPADARVGDLIVYGRPAIPHVGVYLGNGMMVDASPKQGRVVIRRVYAARNVQVVRLG